MGMTQVERIIATRTGREDVRAGERVWLELDTIVLSEDDASCVRSIAGSPRDPSRLFVVPEWLPAAQGAAERYRDLRRFALDRGCDDVLSPGRSGAALAEVVDRGRAIPRAAIAACDPRIGGMGALGALGVALQPAALAEAVETGRTEYAVPESIRIRVEGSPGRWACGADIAMSVVAGDLEIRGRAVEFEGPAIRRLDPRQRLDLTLWASARGAVASFCGVDEATRTWLRARSVDPGAPLAADTDARFASDVVAGIDELEPLVMRLDREASPVRVTELAETPLDVVILGGACGGRIEDLRAASRLLREHPVAAATRLLVIPATCKTALHAVTEGLVTVFQRAGAMVLPSSSALEAHLPGCVAPGERALWTGATWVAAGDDGVERYVASPLVAAASAVMGRLAHPDEVLRSRREAI